MKTIFSKLMLAALVAALVLAAVPVTGVSAEGEIPNEKLEKAWERVSQLHERLGKMLDGSDERIEQAQERLDKAKADGKDTAAVQTALNNFAAAVKKAKPIYESMNGLFNGHQGFDANGKVTDAAKAQATLKDIRAKMAEFKTAMNGTGKALRDALKAFREANKPSGQ